jgi:hypothetical protein
MVVSSILRQAKATTTMTKGDPVAAKFRNIDHINAQSNTSATFINPPPHYLYFQAAIIVKAMLNEIVSPAKTTRKSLFPNTILIASPTKVVIL